jgi:hypothetical protein
MQLPRDNGSHRAGGWGARGKDVGHLGCHVSNEGVLQKVVDFRSCLRGAIEAQFDEVNRGLGQVLGDVGVVLARSDLVEDGNLLQRTKMFAPMPQATGCEQHFELSMFVFDVHRVSPAETNTLLMTFISYPQTPFKLSKREVGNARAVAPESNQPSKYQGPKSTAV